jgi:uncharacterized damage-inducible protein DinB
MEAQAAEDLRYPVGAFKFGGKLIYAERERLIGELEDLPARLRAAVEGLSDARLDTPYREGGWTVRQVVHHLADSHLNAYIRVRLLLTEHNPTVKPYDQALWAKLHDAVSAPIKPSLDIVSGVHQRFTLLLRSLGAADFEKTLNHPENGAMTLDHCLAMYAWHGRHHLGHITSLARRMGWS